MMKSSKSILIFSVLLLCQVGLVLAVNLGGRRIDKVNPGGNLFGFTADRVKSLELVDGEGKRLLIQKKGDTWILPERFGAPADGAAVEGLLGKIVGLHQGFVVATSDQSIERLKVADDSFEHHVVLRGGNDNSELLADFYTGTSPAFRQVHLRKKGSKEVISVELSAYELDPEETNWLSKDLARIESELLVGIRFDGFTLKKEGDTWRLEGQTPDEELKKTEVDDLVRKVRDFTVQELVDPEKAKPLFAKEAALVFQLTLREKASGKENGTKQAEATETKAEKSGERQKTPPVLKHLEYRFAKLEDDDGYVLKRSDSSLYLKVHKIPVESLQKIGRQDLLAENHVAEKGGTEQSQQTEKND